MAGEPPRSNGSSIKRIKKSLRIASTEGLGLPATYRQAFEILKNHGILSDQMSVTMGRMVSFRTISVHDYEKVKPEILVSIVNEKLVDFENFIKIAYDRSLSWG